MQPAAAQLVDVPDAQEALADALQAFRTESGRTLQELAEESPVLLIFLRHFGCSFCREALDQVSGIQEQLQARGVRPLFVHLGSPERAKPYFDYYKLSNVERVSNPAFHLPRKHPLFHFLVPGNWKRWLQSAIRKHGIGAIKEDAHQMPGVFFLRDGKIVRSFRYRTIADQPNYLKLSA
jgi:hypothetical protein